MQIATKNVLVGIVITISLNASAQSEIFPPKCNGRLTYMQEALCGDLLAIAIDAESRYILALADRKSVV